jgi:hypothetical protein
METLRNSNVENASLIARTKFSEELVQLETYRFLKRYQLKLWGTCKKKISN